MVADDDAAILDATTLFLEMKGYTVIPVDKGDVFSSCAEKNPDLLLLDIWMSGVDGRDVCRRIKEDKRTKNIPVILFSAGNDVKMSALNAGANGFIEKPFDVADLLTTLKQFHLPRQ